MTKQQAREPSELKQRENEITREAVVKILTLANDAEQEAGYARALLNDTTNPEGNARYQEGKASAMRRVAKILELDGADFENGWEDGTQEAFRIYWDLLSKEGL